MLARTLVTQLRHVTGRCNGIRCQRLRDQHGHGTSRRSRLPLSARQQRVYRKSVSSVMLVRLLMLRLHKTRRVTDQTCFSLDRDTNCAPTAISTGNVSPQQSDTVGSLYINSEGRKAFYRVGVIGGTPISSGSNKPTWSVAGSATKTIRITRIRLTATAANWHCC